MAQAAGYSGTPLPAKLGLKDGMTVAFIALPETLCGLVSTRAFAQINRMGAWPRGGFATRVYDYVHAFTSRREELEGGLATLQDAIRRDGIIWISWPKKVSKVATDLTEDTVRAAALKLDLVDIKVAAIDSVWSGLKLVIRKDRRNDG